MELECCNSLQERFLTQLEAELDCFLAFARSGAWPPPQEEVCPLATVERGALSPGVVDRWYFWTGLARRVHREQGVPFSGAREAVLRELALMAKNILYLHRNSRVLKKPGQYQDAIILATTGDNRAYTYTDPRYGRLARKPDESCFGFT